MYEPSIGSQDAVFLTTELLTSILRCLPTKDLLLSQRVSTKWRAVITESLELQQALFMIPEEPTTRWLYERVNFLQTDKLSRVDPTLPLGGIHNGSHIMDCGRLNGLLFKQNRFWPLPERAKNYAQASFHAILPLPAGGPEASWRRMLITQPPLYDLECHLYHDRQRSHQYSPHYVSFETGRHGILMFLDVVTQLSTLDIRPTHEERTYLPFNSFGNLLPMDDGENIAMKKLEGQWWHSKAH